MSVHLDLQSLGLFQRSKTFKRKNGPQPKANLLKLRGSPKVQALLSKGFRPELPSRWLLEGLTGYLTEEELGQLFQQIADLVALAFLGRWAKEEYESEK